MRTDSLAAVTRTMGHGDAKTVMHYRHRDVEIVRRSITVGQALQQIVRQQN